MNGIWQEEQRLARLKTLRSRVDAEIRSIEAGLRRRATSRRPASTGTPAANVPTHIIRAWLLGQGYEIGSRGRISTEMRQEYADAHP